MTCLSTASGLFIEDSLEVSRDDYFLSVTTGDTNARLHRSLYPEEPTLNSRRLRKVQTEFVGIEEHDGEEDPVEIWEDIFFYRDISRHANT